MSDPIIEEGGPMTPAKLRKIADWLDTYDRLTEAHIDLVRRLIEAKVLTMNADTIAGALHAVTGDGMQQDIRRWADELETEAWDAHVIQSTSDWLSFKDEKSPPTQYHHDKGRDCQRTDEVLGNYKRRAIKAELALFALTTDLVQKIDGMPEHPWIPGANFADGQLLDALHHAQQVLGGQHLNTDSDARARRTQLDENGNPYR